MAGISAEVRDLAVVEKGFHRWWAERHPDDVDPDLTPFATNPSSGFSSESLLFEVTATRDGHRTTDELVLRLPPLGGGLFPEYDLERQGRAQELIASTGSPAPAPVEYEADPEWVGTPFLVMPRIRGRLLGDSAYLKKGWLLDGGAPLQTAVYEGYVDALVGLVSTSVAGLDVDFLARDGVSGLAGEINWWSGYLDWAMDGAPHPIMTPAYEWARETAPPDVDPPTILWGDARFANAIFDDDGTVVGILDFEQAAIGPAEFDVGFWLATRRQVCENAGLLDDPEMPGFLDRATTLARIEAGLGRPLRAIEWHETFSMVRMGACIVGTQSILRRSGQHDHPWLQAPPLPAFALEAIDRLN